MTVLKNKHILRISSIEEGLGITGKSIHKWIVGQRPLPKKWEKPLFDYLYPLLDRKNALHQDLYQFDKVVILRRSDIKNEFKRMNKDFLKKEHFHDILIKGADVIYMKFKNKMNTDSFQPIYSRYRTK